MNYEEKSALARTGDSGKEAAALRLKAARRAIGMGQTDLGRAVKLTKAAISNSENAQSFPSRSVMIYLYKEHRIDLNFLICGDFAQLPGDVQDRIFAALEAEERAEGQMQD